MHAAVELLGWQLEPTPRPLPRAVGAEVFRRALAACGRLRTATGGSDRRPDALPARPGRRSRRRDFQILLAVV